MTDPNSTNLWALKDAMYSVAKSMFANDPNVLVSYGHPGIETNNDRIIFTAGTSAQVPATLTATRRTREETLTQQVYISSFSAGEADNDLVPSNRVAFLLEQIEYYTRITDTTLGGVVRFCFLTDVQTDGITVNTVLGSGRLIDCLATFTAVCRITN